MRRRFFERFADLILAHRGVFLAVTLVLTLAALGWLAAGNLRMDSSRHALVNAEDPEQIRLMEFNERFGTNDLIVVLQSDDRAAMRAVADELATAFRAVPEVKDVFHRVDIGEMAGAGLWFASVEDLKRLKQGLENLSKLAPDGDRKPVVLKGVTDALHRLNEGIAEFEDDQSGLEKPDLTQKDIDDLGDTAAGMFDELRQWIEDPGRAGLGLQQQRSEDTDQGFALDDAGYLSAGDDLLLMRVLGDGDMIDQKFTTPLINRLRDLIADHTAEGVTVGLTGIPAMVTDEQRALERDMPLTSTVSAVGCILLFLLAYRSLLGTLVVVLPLLAGIAWGMGAASFSVDALNTFTGSFLVIIIGLGIDFCVHLFTRIRLEREKADDPGHAIHRALVGIGPPILVGAMTTAIAFATMMFTEFRGTRELGTVASSGLVLVLLSTLVVMPLILSGKGAKLLEPRGDKPLDAGLGFVIPRKAAWLVLAIGLGLSVWLGLGIKPIAFDFDTSQFLPRDAPSLTSLRRLEKAAPGGVEFAALEADSLEKAYAQAEAVRALKKDTDLVARVESIVDLLPEDLEAKVPVVSALRGQADTLGELSFEATPAPDPARFITVLEGSVSGLQTDLPFTLTILGEKDLAEVSKRIGKSAAQLLEAARKVEPDYLQQRLAAFEAEASEVADSMTTFIKAEDRPFRVTDLPRSLISPFYSAADGHVSYATRVYPAGNISKAEFADRFRVALRQVDPSATGYAINYAYFGVLFERGLRQAVIWAAIAVLLLVWIDLRSFRHTILALVPLALGGLWMVGLMEVIGIAWTFANGVAMALIIGIGVDSGVHLVHRWRENGGDVPDALRTSGKAIAVSSMTTMIAFGSMSLAAYEGMRSLGLVLLIGVGSCLFATLVVLPGLLYLVPSKKERVSLPSE